MKLPGKEVPRCLVTITTHGPSRLTARTPTTGGANPTTLLRPTTTTTSTTLARFVLMTTSGLRTVMATVKANRTSTVRPLPPAPPPATAPTSRRHPRDADKWGGLVTPTAGTPMAVTRTSMRRSLTMIPMPSPTRPSLTMSGTTAMLTSGAVKLGAPIRMSMVPLPTAPRPLPPRLPRLDTASPPDTMVPTDSTVPTARATLTRVKSGRALLTRRPLLPTATITTPGPSRPTVRTKMPDGANLTIPSRLVPTTTRSTPDGFRLMTTSGLRTTIVTTTRMAPSTARLLPSGPRTVATEATDATARATVARLTPPLSRVTQLTLANPAPSGMLGAVTTTSTVPPPTVPTPLLVMPLLRPTVVPRP